MDHSNQESAFVVALAQHGVPTDVQEMICCGKEGVVPPGGLRKALKASANPYELTLLLAPKQAVLMLAEIRKMLGKSITDCQPELQLLRAITDFENWNKKQST